MIDPKKAAELAAASFKAKLDQAQKLVMMPNSLS
jgi:hypothetical protein